MKYKHAEQTIEASIQETQGPQCLNHNVELRHWQLPKDDGHRSVHLRIVYREGSAGRDDAGGDSLSQACTVKTNR